VMDGRADPRVANFGFGRFAPAVAAE
jgi:hypothetical protein